MKVLLLLSFVLFESSKDSSTSALLVAVALVLKNTLPPELLFFETLKVSSTFVIPTRSLHTSRYISPELLCFSDL
jgi:hypothetical protein